MSALVRRLAALVALVVLTGASALPAQTVPAEQLSALRYRYIGPQGNRVSSVAGIPGDASARPG